MDIQAIVVIHTGEYRTLWTFLTAAGIQLISIIVNLTWGKHMNIPETLIIVIHFVAFLLFISMLAFAVGTGTVSPNFSFFSFTGWSPGFGVVLGLVYVVGVFSGFDSVSHLGQ
jgi:amino acid transporter